MKDGNVFCGIHKVKSKLKEIMIKNHDREEEQQ